MRVGARCAVFALLIAIPRLAGAATITVAEFRWDAELVDPGLLCDAGDPDCQARAAVFLSTYTLTGLWDDASPGPTLTGAVALGDGNGFDWLAISPDTGYFDQLAFETPLPDSASTTILFDFDGVSRSLSALLTTPGFALLQFDVADTTEPVPEPGTLTLVGLGLAGAIRLRRRAAAGRSARS
jgi:hypothetical protein